MELFNHSSSDNESDDSSRSATFTPALYRHMNSPLFQLSHAASNQRAIDTSLDRNNSINVASAVNRSASAAKTTSIDESDYFASRSSSSFNRSTSDFSVESYIRSLEPDKRLKALMGMSISLSDEERQLTKQDDLIVKKIIKASDVSMKKKHLGDEVQRRFSVLSAKEVYEQVSRRTRMPKFGHWKVREYDEARIGYVRWNI